MKIENKIIDTLHYSQISGVDTFYILNSIVKTIDFTAYEPNVMIVIENSIVNDLLIHSCWFRKGLIFKNNHVINYIDYQMGGHNKERVTFSGNIFHEFFNFFDCYFTSDLVLVSNNFLKGSNLTGNIDEGWKNIFDKELIIKENIGLLNLNGIGLTT